MVVVTCLQRLRALVEGVPVMTPNHDGVVAHVCAAVRSLCLVEVEDALSQQPSLGAARVHVAVAAAQHAHRTLRSVPASPPILAELLAMGQLEWLSGVGCMDIVTEAVAAHLTANGPRWTGSGAPATAAAVAAASAQGGARLLGTYVGSVAAALGHPCPAVGWDMESVLASTRALVALCAHGGTGVAMQVWRGALGLPGVALLLACVTDRWTVQDWAALSALAVVVTGRAQAAGVPRPEAEWRVFPSRASPSGEFLVALAGLCRALGAQEALRRQNGGVVFHEAVAAMIAVLAPSGEASGEGAAAAAAPLGGPTPPVPPVPDTCVSFAVHWLLSTLELEGGGAGGGAAGAAGGGGSPDGPLSTALSVPMLLELARRLRSGPGGAGGGPGQAAPTAPGQGGAGALLAPSAGPAHLTQLLACIRSALGVEVVVGAARAALACSGPGPASSTLLPIVHALLAAVAAHRCRGCAGAVRNRPWSCRSQCRCWQPGGRSLPGHR